MTWFEASRDDQAVVPVARDEVWAVLTDPDRLARLTPMLDGIDADGDVWTWRMSGLSVLGSSITPSFTEQMTFDEPSGISFTHAPPDGARERAGAEGSYGLAEVDDGTDLTISLTIAVDLPLPKLSRSAVTKTMAGVLSQMGRGFAKNLADELGYA